MEQDFADRVVVITGAASGIGLATAIEFARRGARIVGVDVNDDVTAIGDDLPGEGHVGLVKDLRDPSAGDELMSEVVDSVGTPQVLVNSAGLALLDSAIDVTPETWQKTLDVNLSATFYMAQAAGRVMLAASYGRIINLASQAAVIALDQHVAYAASKAAIVGMTRVLSLEWADRGVTVNAVSPTVVETPLGKAAWAGDRGRVAREEIPTRRFARPEEVAALIAFLASDAAAMITGSNVLIDGGRTTV